MSLCKCPIIRNFCGLMVNCSQITTPLQANQTGVHLIRWSFGGIIQEVQFNALAGQVFVFPHFFNEYSTPIFQIIQPDSTIYQDENQIKCFSIQISTQINRNLIVPD